MKLLNRQLIGALSIAAAFSASADAPADYYTAVKAKTGKNLLIALYQTITDHHNVGYKGLYTVYQTSDVYPDGTVWDMYSTKHWSFGSKCGNYAEVGDCFNREHSFPKSWFDDASPMYSDAYHIYPTDGKVNGQRSNHPYGECAYGTTLSAPGNIKALGRLGNSTFPGYSGTVFEPDDQYKGDFARSYFYMAACYNNRIAGWNSDMLAHNNYPCFSSWAIDLLMKWHRQDPVSDKERNRNDAVYAHQKNRNPFIDHPELAEHIWGNKTNVNWSANGTIDPEFNYPAAGAAISIGNIAVNATLSTTIYIKGTALKENVSINVGGDSRFTVSNTSLKADAVNSSEGAPLTVYFTSSQAGTATATITATSGNTSVSFTVSATAHSSLTALAPVVITDEGFTARWVNIDPAGTLYKLFVAYNGSVLAGYPVSVNAEAGNADINDLEPETTYTYWVESPALKSNTVTVTTAPAIPAVRFMFDGDLEFYTVPGTPSDIAEIVTEIDNIPGDVTVTVKAPFEVSTDRSTWSRSIILTPGEDRFYLRVNSSVSGDFSTSLVATADGGFLNDDAVVHATVAAAISFVETFPEEATSYNTSSYTGNACNWTFSNAGIWSSDDDSSLPDGTGRTVRFGKNTDSYIAMSEDKPHGIGDIAFYARTFNKDGDAELDVQVSGNQGTTWDTAGHVQVTGTDWNHITVPVNRSGNLRVRFNQTAGKRLNLGHITISDYTISGLEQTLDYHRWDTFCRDNRLVITTSGDYAPDAAIYDMTGITCFSGRVASETEITLPAGLYIVVIDNYARRVVVK